MKTFLQGFIGKKIDVVCTGGVAVSGTAEAIETDVLVLKDDEDKVCYVAVDKITVVWETQDKTHRTGFRSGIAAKN